MRTERERMLAGELYRPDDPQLVAARLHARQLLRAYNDSPPHRPDDRRALLERLLGGIGENAWIEPPFRCDYGTFIRLGARAYLNFDCVVLDCGYVDIGDDVMFGPGVHLYAATHPLDAAERCSGRELGRPVRIGKRVWLGGGTLVMPGVSVGDDTTVGAGSVVTRDLPPRVVAAGNPCRVLRPLG